MDSKKKPKFVIASKCGSACVAIHSTKVDSSVKAAILGITQMLEFVYNISKNT